MHLKNFSLLTDLSGKIKLTPAYDLINSTIAMTNSQEELALSLRDKKKGFKKEDFISFATEDLFLPPKKAENEIRKLIQCVPDWLEKIDSSFLSKDMKLRYKSLVESRARRLSK